MPRKHHHSRPPRAAFTLVEVLVSMVVLLLLVLMVTQLVGGASATTTLQTARLDTDRQARLIFDRMAADFSGMVRRTDVDCSAYKYPNYRTNGNAHFKRQGNDSILFFAEADSQNTGIAADAGSTSSAENPPSSQDELSLVGYRIFDNPMSQSTTGSGVQGQDACFRLERLGQGFGWSESSSPGFGLPFLTFSGVNVVPNGTITTYWPKLNTYNAAGQNTVTAPSHVIGENVFRMEFALLMKDKQANNSNYLASDGQGTGYLDYTDAKQRAFSGVSAIVVTIALLNQPSRVRLGNSDARYQAINTVVGKLVDGDGPDVASQWMTTLLTDQSIPRVFATNAYVYQRYFYLR